VTCTQALRSDPAFRDGFYDRSTDVHVGLRRHAQAFALMGPTSAMYRDEGASSASPAATASSGLPQAYFLPMDPNKLLTQAAKARRRRLGQRRRRHGRRPRRITASRPGRLPRPVLPPEDIKADADPVPGAKFVETGTCWGHFTMFNLRSRTPPPSTPSTPKPWPAEAVVATG
jgi:homoserine O-acetyltransferase